MAGSQQAMANLMCHRIAHEEVERQPESGCLRPDGRHEHAGVVPALRGYDRVAHMQGPVFGGKVRVVVEPDDDRLRGTRRRSHPEDPRKRSWGFHGPSLERRTGNLHEPGRNLSGIAYESPAPRGTD